MRTADRGVEMNDKRRCKRFLNGLFIIPIRGARGICFRLITKKLQNELSNLHRAQLLTMQLDKMCLTVKLLSPHKLIAEYFQNTIVKPPILHISDSVERLKKLEVLNSSEAITWLGCRLIDIPVECHLGKLLVFGILLQCLDPILTIVSFLKSSDPLEFPGSGFELQSYAPAIRYKCKQERNRLAEGSLSDHLMFIRLYQEWQEELRGYSTEVALADEHEFYLNGILERISGIRMILVGTLRSSQLIHNQGHFNMHYVNLKSNTWPIIKAALVGGLYPQICVRDSCKLEIKSPKSRKIIVDPSSVNCECEKVAVSAPNTPSTWIVYSKEICSANCNKILCCTVVAPIAVAMFAGPAKIHPLNMNICGETICEESLKISNKYVNFIIDDWIWFNMHISNSQLILRTRQHFFSLYMVYLQYCTEMESWRHQNVLNQRFLDTLESVILREDISCDFKQPTNIGLRPKAVPNKNIVGFKHTSGKKRDMNEKQFFLVHLPASSEMLLCKSRMDWLHKTLGNLIGAELERLTYVIVYQNNLKLFSSVAITNIHYGVLYLQECFKGEVPVHELRYNSKKQASFLFSL